MFQQLLQLLLISIWPLIQLFLLGPIPFDPIFDSPKYQFQKNSLGTGPATPYTPKHNSKQHNTDHRDQHPKYENIEILGIEKASKNGKLSINNVEHQKWFTIYFYERCREQEQ
jgi:hypothetical protein